MNIYAMAKATRHATSGGPNGPVVAHLFPLFKCNKIKSLILLLPIKYRHVLFINMHLRNTRPGQDIMSYSPPKG